MARPEREYRRLPGRGRRRGSFFSFTATRARLWAGKDHVLCVYATGYTEEYKRFYYRDIQAFVTRKTGRGAAWNAVSSLFLFLSALLAITRTSTTAAAVFWILGGIFLIVLAVNLLLGPTCICHVQTAVSREELPSLGRERNARKAIDFLKPLIEAAQGALTPEEIGVRSAELERQPEPAARSRAGTLPAGTVGGYSGKVHEALFYLLLLDGLQSTAQIFTQGLPLAILGAVFTLAFSITVVIALTKQHGGGLTPGLRGITWGAFGYMVATFLVGYIIVFYEMMRNPNAARNGQWELFKMMSHASPADNRVLMFTLVFSAACAIPLGFSGLVLLKKFQAGRKSASAVPPLSGESASPARTGQ
jgi:hypothetical protein